MKHLTTFAFAVLALALFPGVGQAQTNTVPVTLVYGDFLLPAGSTSLVMPGIWSINAGALKINYTTDLTKAPNVAYTGDYSQMAMVGLFGGGAGARMAGFLADWNNPGILFPTFPDVPNSQDIDDKFNLQRFPSPGYYDERMYDVACATNTVGTFSFDPRANYGIWFDRDGVDQWQALGWGMVNGGTYNTNALYPVELLFREATNDNTRGTACAVFSPLRANTGSSTGFGIPTGFYSSWHTGAPDFYPAGISFDADEPTMASMQVYVQGASGPYEGAEIWIRDLTVSGMLVVSEGMATGGGWYIPDTTKDNKLTVPGAKATFGFNARQKDASSSGNLQFVYHGDNLSLTSTSYDWVTISTTQALFEGVGVLATPLGSTANVRFRVAATDGNQISQPDHFTIRIWTGDYNEPVHLSEGDLGGGQIVVHKK